MSNSKIDIRTKFFVYDDGEGLYKCTIDKCNVRLKGALNSLKRHIACLHPEVAKTIGFEKYKSNVSSGKLDEPKTKKLKTIPVEVDPDEFITGLVELASIQGVSLNFFDSSGFKKTGGILANALGLPCHTDAVVLLVQDVARHVRDIISEEMQQMLFCLKFDGACRRNRKILGITAQYIINGKIISRTLSIEDMTERQTGENLKNRINDVLNRFKVTIKNVYASTTDNGRNMIKCTENLRKQQELEIMDDLLDDNDEEEELNEDLERKLVEEDNNVDNFITTVEEIINKGEGCIESIKCGAHTFNLIVKDALATVNDDWLNEIRKFVKIAKRVEYRALFTIAKISVPKLDVETRWSSTWDMIQSVMNNEQTIKEIGAKCPALKLSEETWIKMQEFQIAFKIMYDAIKALQNDNIVMGDLLRIIKQCQFQGKKLPANNPFAQGLSKAVDRRLKNLVDNDAFRAAILFDRRWCFLDSPFFSKEDKLQAIEHVLKVATLLKILRKSTTKDLQQNLSNSNNDDCDDFEAMLQQECNMASTSDNVSQVDLKVKLLTLANSKTRLPASTDILKYWESRRYDEPELYELAMIVLAAPATQVTVERCFSAVKLLLDDHRLNMSSSRLDDLMIIRCNREVLPEAIQRYKHQSEERV